MGGIRKRKKPRPELSSGTITRPPAQCTTFLWTARGYLYDTPKHSSNMLLFYATAHPGSSHLPATHMRQEVLCV